MYYSFAAAADDDNNPAFHNLEVMLRNGLHHPIITILATFPAAEQEGYDSYEVI